jgi:hypothetical protein
VRLSNLADDPLRRSANSATAWYKWGQLVVPLPFDTIGNRCVERFTNYAIGNNNYRDWQIGVGVNVYGFDLSIAYVDTNLGVAGCGNTMNCNARAIFIVQQDVLNVVCHHAEALSSRVL